MTVPSWRSPAVRAPGRSSQCLWSGGSEGGSVVRQPGASGGSAVMVSIMPSRRWFARWTLGIVGYWLGQADGDELGMI